MAGLILTWLVTAVSFLIISRLPFLGIEIDGFGKAAITAIVFGILNAILLPILTFVLTIHYPNHRIVFLYFKCHHFWLGSCARTRI